MTNEVRKIRISEHHSTQDFKEGFYACKALIVEVMEQTFATMPEGPWLDALTKHVLDPVRSVECIELTGTDKIQ